MNELNGGGLMPLIGGIAFAVAGLIAWFFVNRASVRASEQIRLLEALLEEQKKQNAILQQLTQQVAGSEADTVDEEQDRDFTRLIPER
ncbi:YebO family protein [Erwinia sp. PK3-005]|uniref:YebO family protein n=1 Tax=Mixta hanseatica TaxID=2872648 RepID=A0ABY4R3W2_9GAMM|nr:YebO family protein [Mixta hanseatica]UQY42615.1 YebO family protein [Mixta hanseatica]